jgi:hypothetical protein
MVSSLRSRFKHTDSRSNSGIVLSPKIATVYPLGTSVKLVVRPFGPSPADADNLPSVKFTCDVTTTVGHVLWKVLMDLEEKGFAVNKEDSFIFGVSGDDPSVFILFSFLSFFHSFLFFFLGPML